MAEPQQRLRAKGLRKTRRRCEVQRKSEKWKLGRRRRQVWVPPEVKEAAGHSRIILLLFFKLPIPLQAALPTLVQVRGYIDAGPILQEGLSRLLQLLHLAHIFQHWLANCGKGRGRNGWSWLVLMRPYNMIHLGMHSCPDLAHSSLPWLGLCLSGPSLTEREGAKRLQLEAKDHGENLWEVSHYEQTTLAWVRKTQEGRR